LCPGGEMADTRDLKSLGRKTVPVRVRPRAPFFCNMQDFQTKVNTVLHNHNQQINEIDSTLPINVLVKHIDKICQDTQSKLYKLIDSRVNIASSSKKKGHCC
jgi:hypothetical protein